MKLLLDMHLSVEVARRLRALGYDAVQLGERGLHRLADEQVVQLARLEGRVVVTFDLDFSGILARSREARPSLVQFRTDDTRPHSVARLLIALLPAHEYALEQGCIVNVEPDRVRVRRLPLDVDPLDRIAGSEEL